MRLQFAYEVDDVGTDGEGLSNNIYGVRDGLSSRADLARGLGDTFVLCELPSLVSVPSRAAEKLAKAGS